MKGSRRWNRRAAWWTPRRFSMYLVVMLLVGVFAIVDGMVWQRGNAIAVAVLGSAAVLADLALIGVVASKQGWRWFLRRDNSTTRWQR